MIGIGQTTCNHCREAMDGDDLDCVGVRQYCYTCMVKLAPVAIKAYAASLNEKANGLKLTADALLAALEAGK